MNRHQNNWVKRVWLALAFILAISLILPYTIGLF